MKTAMKQVKIAPGVTYTLLDAAPESDDDFFLDDLMDIESNREEKMKVRWNAQVSDLGERLKSGEFDHYLEDLFSNWESTGYRDAIVKTKWPGVIRDEMDVTGFTENDLRRFAKHLSKPNPANHREPTARTYGSRILHSLIVHKFSNDVWNDIEAGLKGNPYRWIFLHSLKYYAGKWMVKNGYWQETQDTMNEAKQVIEKVLENHELDDLMNVDIGAGFNKVDKEAIMEEAWNRERNRSRDLKKSKVNRIYWSVQEFVLRVGSAMHEMGYEMDETPDYGIDGVETMVPVVSQAIIAMAVDWAGDWLVKNGYIRPESLPHLKEMFS